MEDYGDSVFQGFKMTDLNLDQFYLNTNGEPGTKYYLYQSHRECIECPYTRVVKFNESSPNIVNINYKFKIALNPAELLYDNNNYLCNLDQDFGEFGIYNVSLHENGCSVNTVKEPVNIYLPLLTVAGIYILFSIFLAIACYVYKVYTTEANMDKQKPQKERIRSIDTFRGISIAIMVFVNYGGGGYELFEHAIWNGLHLADFAFPWFMWIMGVCIPISLSSSFKRNISNIDLLKNILKRSIKLFAIGLFLGGGTVLESLRVFGVLQRFGVCYFISAAICIFCIKRNNGNKKQKNNGLQDILKLIYCWIVVIIIVTIYVLILVFVHKPECPRGYFGPGGLHKNRSYENCIGGATGYVDELILGKHMYQYPTAKDIFETTAFDPEGILGCLPTILHVFLGVQAGIILLEFKAHSQRLIRWFSWGIVTGLIGGGLCNFSKEDGIIPVNKNLWSLSYVFVTSGFAFIVLAFCYLLIDLKKWWSGKPFLFAGMNAILMYIGHEMTGSQFPIRWILEENNRNTHFWCLISDVWGAGIWIFISYYLYKIKYFFTV